MHDFRVHRRCGPGRVPSAMKRSGVGQQPAMNFIRSRRVKNPKEGKRRLARASLAQRFFRRACIQQAGVHRSTSSAHPHASHWLCLPTGWVVHGCVP